MSGLPNRVCGNNHEHLRLKIRLDDHLPRLSLVAGLDHPPPLDNVTSITGCTLKHIPKIHLCEPTINHPLEEMRTQLKFPFPPRGSFLLWQMIPPAPEEIDSINRRKIFWLKPARAAFEPTP